MQIRLTTATVDVERGQVARDDGPTEVLTTMERKALAWLVSRAPAEVSHEELLREVWGYAPGVDSRAPYFTVRRLRSRIEANPAQPRHLITVHGVGYRFVPADAAPAGTSDAASPAPERHTNLGPLAGRLVGRERELAAVLAAVEEPGLVVLAGPAGVGKTRLARHAGQALLRSGAGAWFCDLSDAETEGDLIGSLAQVLDVNLAQPGDPIERLDGALASLGRAVVVLDNFEQLVPDAVPLVGRWRRAAPELALLVTSRVRLRAEGERVVVLDPLGPSDAVQLVRDRALAAGRRLPDDPETDGALLRLVHSADRLPLVLELAAARLAVIGPEALAERLEDPLAVLSRGPRDGPPRHRSLRDAIATSWARLTPPEQAALAACSAFADGFWLEEAEAVLDPDPVPALDRIQALCERSLLQAADVDDVPGDVRFSLLLSVRSFAAEALAQSGAAARVQARHADAYAAVGDRLEQRIAVGDPSALRRLRLETRNLRAGLQRATDPAVAARLAIALDRLLRTGAPPEERRAVAEQAVVHARASGDLRLEARARLVRAIGQFGTPERPEGDLAEVRRIAEATGDRELACRAALAEGHDRLGRGEAGAAHDPLLRARELADQLGDDVLTESVLQVVMHQALDSGAFDRCPEIARALVAVRERGLERLPIGNLAVWYQQSGDRPAMLAAWEVDLDLHRRAGDRNREVLMQINIGVDELRHDPERARRRLGDAVLLARRIGNLRHEALGRYNLAVTLLAAGEIERGLGEAVAAATIARRIGHPRFGASFGNLVSLGHLLAGDPARAAAESRAARAQAEEAGDAYLVAWARVGAALAAAVLGDRALADAEFAAGHAWIAASPLAGQMRESVALNRALVWAAAGSDADRAAARRVLEEYSAHPGASTRVMCMLVAQCLDRRA